MPWYFGVVESRHELQNPTSPERIRLLGERLQLGPGSRVLARDAGVDAMLEFVHADAIDVPLEPGGFDVALCLGAAFLWNDLAGTLAALAPAARSFVAVGEPHWRSWPVPTRSTRSGEGSS